MFTGLIEQKGRVVNRVEHDLGQRLIIEADYRDVVAGESIAVNGVCLTAMVDEAPWLTFDVSPETLACTNLASLQMGDALNLERAMQASSRWGGHYVTGHIDTMATVESVRELGEFLHVKVSGFAAHERAYLIPKGSITLDGVSLTINAVDAGGITLMLVPHTLSRTTLSTLFAGRRVNVEFDYIARVVVHQLGFHTDSTIMAAFTRPSKDREVVS